MAETYRCDGCGENFESLDNWAEHLHNQHDVPEGGIKFSYKIPEQDSQQGELPQTANGTFPPEAREHQQLDTPIRALVENPQQTEELVDTIFGKWKESQEQTLRYRFRFILIVAVLFLAVLIASSYLTQQQILPGSAYTLLLGTIIGYLLTFLEEYL